jgi:hypothetical protein
MMRYRNFRTTPAERAAIKAANAARKAERAAKAATCQICARPILANTGTIAHHGYKRPGHGWQTASCFGAKYRPYEVACDALPPAIKSVEAHIARVEALLAEWLATPPAAIQCDATRKGRWNESDWRVEWSVLRPARFNPSAPVDRQNDKQAKPDYMPAPRHSYGFRPCDLKTYAAVYAGRIAELRADIVGSKETLEHFRKRLADWKSPE